MAAERRVCESDACTRGIRVLVRSSYVPERSEPEQGRWFFAYEVRISNEGSDVAQLVSRHWIITDADGKVQEVRGPGVVGEQPGLAIGQGFEDTSACPLETAYGTMHGSYQMVTAAGDRFDAVIAPFLLGEPKGVH
jgi:ApaG protein